MPSTPWRSEIEVPKSPCKRPHPDPELLDDRFVEPVERAQAVDVLVGRARRQHHRDGIAGGHADHEEDHDGHPDQGDHMVVSVPEPARSAIACPCAGPAPEAPTA
jgi:hypothetical protein